MDYNQILDDLRTGELEAYILEAEHFPEFFEVWRNYPYQSAIVGEAGRKGQVTYRKRPENQE